MITYGKSTKYCKGLGTKDSPWIVKDINGLIELSTDEFTSSTVPDIHVSVVADIDCEDAPKDICDNFPSLFDSLMYRYHGSTTIHGNNHTIRNMRTQNLIISNVGMYWISGGIYYQKLHVYNLNIENFICTGSSSLIFGSGAQNYYGRHIASNLYNCNISGVTFGPHRIAGYNFYNCTFNIKMYNIIDDGTVTRFYYDGVFYLCTIHRCICNLEILDSKSLCVLFSDTDVFSLVLSGHIDLPVETGTCETCTVYDNNGVMLSKNKRTDIFYLITHAYVYDLYCTMDFSTPDGYYAIVSIDGWYHGYGYHTGVLSNFSHVRLCSDFTKNCVICRDYTSSGSTYTVTTESSQKAGLLSSDAMKDHELLTKYTWCPTFND